MKESTLKSATPAAATALITVEPDGLGIESGNPQWDRARKILEGIKMAARMNLAGQVMLGGELLTLKETLGFMGSGRRRKESVHDEHFNFASRTWDDWCRAELGISRITAERFIGCFRLIRRRGEALADGSPAYRLLCAPVATLDEAERKILGNIVNELLKGDSQKDLLHELKIVNGQHRLTGGDTSRMRKPADESATVEKASEFFRIIFDDLSKMERTVSRFRDNKSFDSWLYLLPLEPAGSVDIVGLRDFQRLMGKLHESIDAGLTAMLAKVADAIEAKMEPCKPPSNKSRRRHKATKRKP